MSQALSNQLASVMLRLDDLEARLTRVEAALPRATRPAAQAAPPPVTRPATHAPPPPPPKAPPQVPARAPATAPPASRPVAATPAPRDSSGWEALVGGWWFAILGACIVVAGLGFGVKFAWDQGWLRLSELARVLLVAGFGTVLVGAGEFVLRRWGRPAAVGLFGAGLGALYLAGWSASGAFELVSRETSFLLLVVVAVLGCVIAVRGGMLSMAIVGLLGGYAAPMLANAPDASPFALPPYVAMLLVVGVGLAWWRPRFAAARVVAWSCTALWATVWFIWEGEHLPLAAIGYAALLWLIYHADAYRRVSTSDRAARAMAAGPEGEPRTRLTFWQSVLLLGSAAWTAWAALLTSIGASVWDVCPPWMPIAGLGVASALAGFVLAGHLRVFTERPRTAGERFGAVLMVQAGGLLIAAIAVGIPNGYVQAASWLTIGLAACTAARWVRSRGLTAYGLVVLAFATGRVALGVLMMPGGPRFEPVGLVLTPLAGLAAATGLSWIAAAVLSDWRPRGVRTPSAWALPAVFGACLVGVSVAHNDAHGLALCAAWALLGLGFIAAGAAWKRTGLEFGGFVGLAFAALFWLGSLASKDWDARTPGPGMDIALWTGLLITAWAFGAWLVARRLWLARGWRIVAVVPLGVLALLMLWASTSAEVARSASILATESTAERGAVSLWWGLFAVGLLVGGAVGKSSAVRWGGLGLMLVAACKAVLFDLAAVHPAVRAASFLGLGVLMLAVGVVYTRAVFVRNARRRTPVSSMPQQTTTIEEDRGDA